jgi:dolichol-phosphate mannosyltransferase
MTTIDVNEQPADESDDRAEGNEAVRMLNKLVPVQEPSLEELLVPDRPLDARELSLRTTCAVTVVVPTRNEEGNVAPLVERLDAALAGHHGRILFVDDSDDDTPIEVMRMSALSDTPVDLLHRPPDERQGGLGGAVLEGLRATTAPWAVVMDGDLQHPPELVPDLVTTGMREHAQVVVATRRAEGGSSQGLANFGRSAVSSTSTVLSKLVFPRNLRGISDPMSGFFAVRVDAFDLDVMRPQGFKILLEMLAREDQVAKAEIPFTFGERVAGDSKASVREGITFLSQLVNLRVSATLGKAFGSGRLQRGLGFAGVGVTGLVVNMLIMWLLADPATLHLNYLLAAVLTTQLSSTWNFVLVDSVVYRGSKRLTKPARYVGFMLMSNMVLLLRIPFLALLVSVLGVHYLIANVLTLFLGYLVRFRSQERLTLLEESS